MSVTTNPTISGFTDGAAVGGVPLGYPQIPVGSFGDSIASFSQFGNQDVRRVSGVYGINQDRMPLPLIASSNGAIRMVFNGGVSGDTTTQMLAREAAGASSTRKAMADAVTAGVRYLVFSAGINDLQNPNLAGGASQATIDSTVAAAVTRTKQLLRRAVSLGLVPIFPALLGYSYVAGSGLQTATAANVPTTQAAIRQFNAAMKAEITAANGALGYFVDSFLSSVVDASGNWLPNMDQGDGLHPGQNGANLIYAPVARLICSLSGVSGSAPFAYPDGLPNLVSNADFSASTGGVATGLNIYTQVGTATQANSLVEWRGQMWQQVVCTPTALDVNGNAGVAIEIPFSSAGIAASDVIGGELSLYVDDGSGGQAPVFQHCVRLRTDGTYTDSPSYNTTISPKVAATAPIDRRAVASPIVSPGAAPATAMMMVIVFVNALRPFRVMVSRPRVVELPATY